jgi:hypothetical protein
VKQAEIDGRAVAKFCATATRTKAAIQAYQGWSASRTQRAIDWCKRESLITKDPFYCVYDPIGKKYTYGYRHTLTELRDHLRREIGYCRSRLGTASWTIDRALASRAQLYRAMTPKQRGFVSKQRITLMGVVAALESMLTDVEQRMMNP